MRKGIKEREKGNKNRSHDGTKKAPKPCEVLQRFIAKLNESINDMISSY